MSGTAVGDDSHTVRICQLFADDKMALHFEDIAAGKAQPLKFFIRYGLRAVHELFHFHSYHLRLSI